MPPRRGCCSVQGPSACAKLPRITRALPSRVVRARLDTLCWKPLHGEDGKAGRGMEMANGDLREPPQALGESRSQWHSAAWRLRLALVLSSSAQ